MAQDATDLIQQARALGAVQRWDEARDAAQAALALDPESVPAYRLLAGAQLYGGNPEAATETVAAGLRLAPDDARLHLTGASAYYELRRCTEAIDHAHVTMRIAPNHPDAYVVAALARIRAGTPDDLDHAAEEIRIARQLAPSWAEVFITQGYLHLARDERRLARDCATEALRLEPDSQRGQLLLADVEAADARSGTAIDLLTAALRLDPDNEAARKRLDGLILEAMVGLAWLAFALVAIGLFIVAFAGAGEGS
ncbi:MAG: tetratricopeptide repeat protein [Actinomycetota bacterium]